MGLEGPQTTPRSPLMIMSLWKSLRFSWIFSTMGLRQFTTWNGGIRLIPFLSIARKRIPTEEWCKLLIIASKLDCKEVRARAIDELTMRKNKVSSISRIELGNKYDVPQWLPGAYADTFVRESHLTIEEGEKLGLEVTVKVLEGRDKCKRNGWNSSGDTNVIQLVKEIFPPSTSLLRNSVTARLAGRPVYRVSRESANFNLSTSGGATLTLSSSRSGSSAKTR